MVDRHEKYEAAEAEARGLLAPGWTVEHEVATTSDDDADDAHVLVIWPVPNEDGSSWQVYDRADEVWPGKPGTGWVAIWQPNGQPDLENERVAPTLAAVLRKAGLTPG